VSSVGIICAAIASGLGRLLGGKEFKLVIGGD
jgi:hypothetical protein